MIILPDRNIPRARILMPVPKKEWMAPSLAQPKDQLGNDTTRTLFRVRARLNDGYIKWTGWFQDRDDYDAFLWAIAKGTLKQEKELWKLPTPQWYPDLSEELSYDFATLTFLTTTGSNQTYTSPSDWNNSNNSIECIGGAGSGGASSGKGTGGGGGAYSKITNFSFATPGTTTATYRVGSGGTAVTDSGTGGVNGVAGTATWFNNATDPGNGTDNTKCSAAGGSSGLFGATFGTANGGIGGNTTSSWGQTKYAGGRGGNLTGSGSSSGSGGGGAAGPSGAGGAGGDSSSTSDIATIGGSANNGATAGGAATGGSGSSGTEFDPSYGCGSGGGGRQTATDATAGSGGNYGGAGGGAAGGGGNNDDKTSGAGRQGLIVITYTPVTLPSLGNLPMLGM